MIVGFLVGDKAMWATDFVTDVTDGFLVGERAMWATDFVTDVTDGLF